MLPNVTVFVFKLCDLVFFLFVFSQVGTLVIPLYVVRQSKFFLLDYYGATAPCESLSLFYQGSHRLYTPNRHMLQ